jgi:hypothetical protein
VAFVGGKTDSLSAAPIVIFATSAKDMAMINLV